MYTQANHLISMIVKTEVGDQAFMNIVVTHLEMNTACVCMYTMGGVIKEVSLFSYFMCHKQRYTVQLV